MGECKKFDKNNFLNRLRNALAIILPLCVLSLLIAAFVCSVANGGSLLSASPEA